MSRTVRLKMRPGMSNLLNHGDSQRCKPHKNSTNFKDLRRRRHLAGGGACKGWKNFLGNGVDKWGSVGYTNSCLTGVPVEYGGVAQLARAFGSYPKCHRFESSRRYQADGRRPPADQSLGASPMTVPMYLGALVKRLRHRPFTAVTRVRFPYASPRRGGSLPAARRLSSAG